MPYLEFRLPDIGEGVTEGEIVEWFVRAGDQVREDDPMVEIMTDKATVTIGAPCDARVEALCFEVGEVARVGQTVLVLEPRGARAAHKSSRPAASAVGQIAEELPGTDSLGLKRARSKDNGNGGTRAGVARPVSAAQRRALPTSPGAVGDVDYFEAKPLATPATRRFANEMGVDLRRVRPSGEHGRVTQDDVRAAVRVAMTEDGLHASLEEREPLVGVRRKIAERMHHAKTTAAHFTFVEECDASRLVDLRDRLAPEAKRRGARLTFLPFVVKAVTEALRRHPRLNSAVDERTNEIVYKKYYNIGIATATEVGLMVPVVREADRMGLVELAKAIERLSRSARDGSLAPRDLRNSTFTITSLGKYGGLLATPILNHPEVAILGVHRIKERPVVNEGRIVIGQVMLLSLSFDHRIVDGAVGAAFAYDVIETLENPERLFYDAL